MVTAIVAEWKLIKKGRRSRTRVIGSHRRNRPRRARISRNKTK
jgi:hypothetical protein